MFVQEINKNESNKMDWIMGFISGVLISTVVDDTKIDGGGTHKEMKTYLLAMNKKGKKELNDLRIKTRIRDFAKRILPRPRSKAELISSIEKWEKNPSAYQPLSAWDTSKITDMSLLFRFKENFNGDIGGWDTSNVTNMSNMFEGASSFNRPIGNWDTSNVKNMHAMFEDAVSFNQDISRWNMKNVNDISNMFYGANSFDKDISAWDTQNVRDMSHIFSYLNSHKHDISEWNTDNVIYPYF